MKQANSFMVFVGWCVAVCAVCYGLYWGYNTLEESGYERHKNEAEEQLNAGTVAAEQLKATAEELKKAKETIASLSSQLELAKTEHAVLAPAFKALIQIETDAEACQKKFPGYGEAEEKCAYSPNWWMNHSLTITDSDIIVLKPREGFGGKQLAKYEFVRDAKGNIVDFKLLPPEQATQR